MAIPQAVTNYIDDLDDLGKAKFAAQVLSDVNPDKNVLEAFFAELRKWDETVLAELCSRAADVECD